MAKIPYGGKPCAEETDPSRYAQCKAALETLTHQVLDKTRRTFRFLVMIMEPSGHSRGGGGDPPNPPMQQV